MFSVPIDELPSLVLTGHGRLPHAIAAGWHIDVPLAARDIVRQWARNRLTWGKHDERDQPALHFALSAAGLRELGLAPDQVAALGRAFSQGIAQPHRARALGDMDQNSPEHWRWSDTRTHLLTLTYAATDERARQLLSDLARSFANVLTPTMTLHVRLPTDRREPFGFRDGLTSSRVRLGSSTTADTRESLEPGAVVCLDPAAPDLCRGASMLVARQLEQDVHDFWSFWRSQAQSDVEAVWLASKAVGRWPNGMPVSGSEPEVEPEYDENTATSGLSFAKDSRGDSIPIGCHVRRANPRDGLLANADESLAATRPRRILRRGRVYGEPAPRSWYPSCLSGIDRPDGPDRAAGERGLLFLALCADIERQFEFIQQTWLNNPKHADRIDEVDPIAAGRQISGDRGRLRIPRDPLRRRIDGLRKFVTVRGGGYFVLLGRSALSHIG